MAVDEDDGVWVCPECPDKIRGRGGRPRDARSTRRNHGDGEVSHAVSEGTEDSIPTTK